METAEKGGVCLSKNCGKKKKKGYPPAIDIWHKLVGKPNPSIAPFTETSSAEARHIVASIQLWMRPMGKVQTCCEAGVAS